jgi:hypothetical protein
MPIQSYRIEKDGIQCTLLKRPTDVVSISRTNAFTCSIESENFDKTTKIILTNGRKITIQKYAIPGK